MMFGRTSKFPIKKPLIFISIIFVASFILALFFFKKIIIVARVNQSSVAITSCHSFNGNDCALDILKKTKIINANFFYNTLEFSLMTPGDYSEDMVDNIHFYKKDTTESREERQRKINQFELNLSLIDHLESNKSAQLIEGSELDLLNEIIKLNNRVNLFVTNAEKNTQRLFVFTNQGLDNLFFQISFRLLEGQMPRIQFASIPPGVFLMGASSKYNDTNEVTNRVTLTKGFELATYETSQLEWVTLMGYNPSFFAQKKYCPNTFINLDGIELCPNHPVETVSFDEISLFISILNSLDPDNSYRLPTEAEWEYASKGKNQATYFFGEDTSKLGDYAWYYENSSHQSHERGLKKPNQFGLYDILGNVFEWTSDYYSELTPIERLDPLIETVSQWKVTKGGSWYARAKGLRPAFRCKDEKKFRYSRIGFRLLRTPKKQ